MIPFAILSGVLMRTCDVNAESGNEAKEIRILELSEREFTFRLADELSPRKPGQREQIALHFYRFAEDSYQEVVLRREDSVAEYTIELIEGQREEAEFFAMYRVRVFSTAFQVCAAALSREYLQYISLKLDGDDARLSEVLVGYPSEKEEFFPESFAQQKRKWFGKLDESCWKRVPYDCYELGLELDRPEWYRLYQCLPLKEFCSCFWEKNSITGHPVTKKEVHFLYIGNQYCHLLFPKETELFVILDKAINEKAIPVLMFSCMQECRIGETKALLDRLAVWCSCNHVVLELVVNDWGMLGLLREQGYPCFSLTLGCLLVKQRRDSRIEYNKSFSRHMEKMRQGPLQTAFFPRYLREHFGISRVSFQSCGYPVDFRIGGGSIQGTLQIPFFQMNTSQFCPVIACMKNGSRGKQEAVVCCNYECQNQSFIYPEFLNMVGRYNSLFGYDREALREESLVLYFLNQGGNRIVIGCL